MYFIAKKGGVSLILDLVFMSQERRTGGQSRSEQLYEIFASSGYSLAALEPLPRPGRFSVAWWGLKGIMKFGVYPPLCLDSIRTTGYNFFKFSFLAAKYPDVSTYVLEGTGFGELQGVSMLKSLGKRIILTPANIESLAPYAHAWTHRLPAVARLKIEVDYFRQADAVFCIAMEETWLLRVLSSNASYLPYFPPAKVLERIRYIRQQRLHSEKKGSLYFANFHNPPNLLGIEKFILAGGHKGKKIRVAGYGVDKVRPLVNEKTEFEVVGELTDRQFEDELISCEQVVLSHYPTSGMLTRVPELLLAGIPVHGDADSLKSFVHTATHESFEANYRVLATDAAVKLISAAEAKT